MRKNIEPVTFGASPSVRASLIPFVALLICGMPGILYAGQPRENSDIAETAAPVFTGYAKPQKEVFRYKEPITFTKDVFNHSTEEIEATTSFEIRRVSDGLVLGGVKTTTSFPPYNGFSFPGTSSLSNWAATPGEYESSLSIEYGEPPQTIPLDTQSFIIIP